jgi:SNF2 family DNA or RNA helicase
LEQNLKKMKRTHRQKSPGGSAFVGKRITKIFGDELYDGTVTSYFSAKETDSNQDLWEISYEDGDVEDMALSNLKAAIALYEKEHAAAGDDDSAVSIGSAQPANKTEMTKEKEDDQEGDEENESLASDEAPEVNESKLAPQDYVGKPVAKKFENELCLGTVTSFTLAKDNDSGEDLYEITYEDGDVEDVLLADLEVELALYNEKQEQDAAASEEQEDEDMSGNESLAHARESKEQQEPAKEVTMADDSDEDEELGATNATTVAAQMAGTSRVTPSPELNAKSNIDADGADLPNVASSAVDSPNAIPAPLLAPLPNLVSSAETGVLSQLPSTVAGAFSDAAHDFAMMQATGGGNSGDEDLPTDMTEEEARIVMSRDRTVDWTEKQKELDKMFEKDASEKFVGIAEFQMPDGFNEDVKLYPHQKDGIRWLLHQETTENAPSFWSQVALGTNKDRLWWRCKITGQFQKRRPNPIRGSILADDMGLGKTLQVIALILSNPAPAGDPRCSVIVCPVTGTSGKWPISLI